MSDTRAPSSTYRLQLHAGFTFADAKAVAPYLADLGVSHMYLSPILQAAPGSLHGYDVVDHDQVSEELGGEDGLCDLASTAHEFGLGVVVDVVPNHMALPTPAWLNRRLWDVLRNGRASESAHWLDVDWELCDGRLGLPILDEPLAAALADGALTLNEHEGEAVIRYRDAQALPVAPGTEGGSIEAIVDRQPYRLGSWRDKDATLGYRRFFDVDTLIAVRVEIDDVFEATHRLLLRLHADGVVDGFRVDHPDGLADPAGYLQRLNDASNGAWVVVEKILVSDERLPSPWSCHGTTGYDAIRVVQGVLAPPTGQALDRIWRSVGDGRPFEVVERDARRTVLQSLLGPEVSRLARRAREALRARAVDVDQATLHDAFAAMLEHADVYRAYLRLDEAPSDCATDRLDRWRERAATSHPRLAHALGLIRELVADTRSTDPAARDLVVRFQQVCGPAMAKGVEDTAFYRWHRLVSLNEVGGDPLDLDDPVGAPARLDDWARHQLAHAPTGLTALSTHDTKRDEDVRARIAAAAEDVVGWSRTWEAVADVADRVDVDPPTAYLAMQTTVGAWPIDARRLRDYLVKAAREAKSRTAWTAPDGRYESKLSELAHACVDADGRLAAVFARWVEELEPYAVANGLSAKLLQLTLPGTPDVYQGCEAVTRSLVDPDNRRAVDFASRAERLAALDRQEPPSDYASVKLLVTARTLRLRRDRPTLFSAAADYGRLDCGTSHAVAIRRGAGLTAVVTRWPRTLAQAGWSTDAALTLPPGRWRDVLGGSSWDATTPIALPALLSALPVALLVREER